MLGEPCSYVSVVDGDLTCEFALEEPGEYWGDAEAQDAAIAFSFVPAGISVGRQANFCKDFPREPKQIGNAPQCGYDFTCSECSQSFRDHSHFELESGECFG